MTTTTVRAKFRATTLRWATRPALVLRRPAAPYHGRVGVVRRFEEYMWTVDFGNGVEHCWLAELTPVRRSA